MTVLSRGEETGLGPTLLAQGRILGVGGVLAAETPAIPSAHWAPPGAGAGAGRLGTPRSLLPAPLQQQTSRREGLMNLDPQSPAL